MGVDMGVDMGMDMGVDMDTDMDMEMDTDMDIDMDMDMEMDTNTISFVSVLTETNQNLICFGSVSAFFVALKNNSWFIMVFRNHFQLNQKKKLAFQNKPKLKINTLL